VLADQSSAGRPQAGDAEVVQCAFHESEIANVHALFRGFAQTVSLPPLIRTQNLAVNIFAEYSRGADSVLHRLLLLQLNYKAASS
jgi:hypothetical protein